jgi:predicted acetyltransferase
VLLPAMSRREIVRSGKVVSVTASEEAEPRVEAFCATLGAGGLLARGKAHRDSTGQTPVGTIASVRLTSSDGTILRVEERPQLRAITAADRPVIERLWQLYSHDMSEVRGTLPNPEGMFKAGRLPTYFDDPDACGYLVSYGDAPAGFAFVTGLTGGRKAMGDFFVVRAARRKRVGHEVARELLGRHPGSWEIGFQAENDGAPEFWRRVAMDAVGDGWREELRPVPGKPHIPHDHFIVFDV